jgi:hypothetical protein
MVNGNIKIASTITAWSIPEGSGDIVYGAYDNLTSTIQQVSIQLPHSEAVYCEINTVRKLQFADLVGEALAEE